MSAVTAVHRRQRHHTRRASGFRDLPTGMRNTLDDACEVAGRVIGRQECKLLAPGWSQFSETPPETCAGDPVDRGPNASLICRSGTAFPPKLATTQTSSGTIASRRVPGRTYCPTPACRSPTHPSAAALRLAEIELENTAIRSPSDGWVGERQARVGQYVRPGTLLLAIVPEDVWVVANFKETQIPDLHIGDSVSVAIDGIPGVGFRGRLESFSPASGAQFALLPPDNATGNFTRIVQRIPVKITLDPGQAGLENLRPGMSAVVALSSMDGRDGAHASPADGD